MDAIIYHFRNIVKIVKDHVIVKNVLIVGVVSIVSIVTNVIFLNIVLIVKIAINVLVCKIKNFVYSMYNTQKMNIIKY